MILNFDYRQKKLNPGGWYLVITNMDAQPNVHAISESELRITLLRNGKEEEHDFSKNSIHIVFPENSYYYPVFEGAEYFIHTPQKNIRLTMDEAYILERKIYELLEAEADERMAEEANTECGYCGKMLGDCWGDHEEDDDRASITSVEIRLNARILAEAREAGV